MKQRITTAEFASRLAQKHPHVKVIGEYQEAKVPIACRCLTCGHSWDTSRPDHLLRQSKYACPNCTHLAQRQKWQEQTKVWLVENRPDIVLDGELGNARSKTWFKCADSSCGHRWESTFRSIRGAKSGCPKCAVRRNAESKTIPEEEFREWLGRNRPLIELVHYINQGSKATFRCLNPGHDDRKERTWETIPEIIRLQGRGLHGCNKCGWRVNGQQHRIDEAEKRSWMEEHKPTILMGDDYRGTSKHCTFTCRACGYIWKTSINVFTNNDAGCPNCAGVARVTEAEFRRRLRRQHRGRIKLIGPYRGYGNKTQFMCENHRCGHTWSIQPVRLTSSKPTGCPACAESGFDINKPAWLYLMGKPDEQQFGITNDLGGRLQKHEREGFLLLDSIGPAPGIIVQAKEAELKLWLKACIGLHVPGRKENWPVSKATFRNLTELFSAAKLSSIALSEQSSEKRVDVQDGLPDVPEEWKLLPRSKLEARTSNSSKFFDGLRCRRGHLSPRFASGSCVECSRLSQLKIGERKKAERRERILAANETRTCPECGTPFMVVPEMHIDKIYCSRNCAGAQSKRNYIAQDPERRREQSRRSAVKRYHE